MNGNTENTSCSLTHYPDTETYQSSFGQVNNPPSRALVTAIGSITDTDVHSLPPLKNSIDTDALDAMFQLSQGGRISPDAQLTFNYYDNQITVKASGIITIQPRR